MTDASFRALLTQGAEDDLEEIHGYLTDLWGSDDADALLDQFLAAIETSEQFPERGAIPKEIEGLGMREFRQVLLQHFRLIYRLAGDRVIVLVIADGRRDLQMLLERRLLGRPTEGYLNAGNLRFAGTASWLCAQARCGTAGRGTPRCCYTAEEGAEAC